MKYVAAYLLASLSGKEPSAEVIKAIFGSVGIDYDESLLSHVFSQLKVSSVISEKNSVLS
jgi:large subunit ribosomal protein LP2